MNSGNRFKSANEDSGTMPFFSGNNIAAVMYAINKIDVKVSATKEHNAIAGSLSIKRMRSGIGRIISLDFHNFAGEEEVLFLFYEELAEKIASDGDDLPVKERGGRDSV